MRSQIFIKWCCVAVLPGLISAGIQAKSIREPRDYLVPPSATLGKPSVPAGRTLPTLTLLNETLNFDCNHQNCRVEATYRIQADTTADLAFDFMLPTKTQVSSRVGGVAVQTQLTANGSWEYKHNEYGLWFIYFYGVNSYTTYRARFSGHLVKGTNEIKVNYSQPLGLAEDGYVDYFSSGSRYIEILVYELAPLKTWRLANNFTMNITVTTPRQRPARDGTGWYASWFTRRTIDCKLPEMTISRTADKVIYQARLKRNFPNYLGCQMGDSDLSRG